MKINLNDLIEQLKNRKAEILYTICENEKVYIPEIIYHFVVELRQITKLIKLLEGGEE